MKYERIDLCGAWELRGDDGKTYNATVPGCVHTDIIEENLYWRDNSRSYRWIEEHDWTYTKTFMVEKLEENAYIVFEGLDTYCDVYLNGKKIGSCENMYVPHKLPADGALKQGENTLMVQFFSPVKKVEGLPKRSGAFTTERLYTRRIQCTYGWDWVDRFVTCGIYRPAYLVFENAFDIDNVYVYTEAVDKYGASVRIFGETVQYHAIHGTAGELVTISLVSPDGKTIYEKKEYINSHDFEECVNITDPQLWYPNGYGEQPLYTLRFNYGGKCHEEKFGIRTVRVVEVVDEPGSEHYAICEEIKKTTSALQYDKNEQYSCFFLYINGVEIMCKGANYVPTEPFISEEKDEKITRVLELAKEAGVNMVRVWGGGIFEKDWFYSECDRLGITVTQDFLMACGVYPEEDDGFIEQLRIEAEYAAKALRNHPSLVWWSGDNENAVNGTYTDENYHGKRAFFHGILPMLRKYDPMRRAFASSPYGGNVFASKTVGTTHNTQYLGNTFNYIQHEDMHDYKEYLNTYTARFIAEEPSLGAVCEQSLLEMMTAEDMVDPDMKMFYWHTNTNPGLPQEILDYLVQFTEKVLGEFQDAKDRLFKLRYAQYEWIRVTLENARSRNRFCNGIIYWMLNDCWPAASGWAFIDYYNRPKAAFYSFKRAAKPIISTIRKKEEEYSAVISNDGIETKTVEVSCKMLDTQTGATTLLHTATVEVPAGGSVSLPFTATLEPGDILLCDLDDGVTDRSFYKDGKLEIHPCDGVEIVAQTETYTELAATKYVHVVELVGDCVPHDNYFSMVPGERRRIEHTKCDAIKMEAYTI